jgi:hypothetical protein
MAFTIVQSSFSKSVELVGAAICVLVLVFDDGFGEIDAKYVKA